jgi:hypothetical protein
MKNYLLRILPIFFMSMGLLSPAFAQSKIDLVAWKKRSQKATSIIDDEKEKITCNTWMDSSGAILEQWLNHKGEVFTRYRNASYVFIVPGVGGRFLRKAWLTDTGNIIEEERRVYDVENRLVCEGIVDPISGVFSLEYRHRYSKDGKTQYTIEYKNGRQIGEETSSIVE